MMAQIDEQFALSRRWRGLVLLGLITLCAVSPVAGAGDDEDGPRRNAATGAETGADHAHPVTLPGTWSGTLAAPVVEGRITVGPAHANWDGVLGVLRVGVAFPDRPSPRSMLRAANDRSVERQTLNRMVADGRAAGLHGVLYDNRDRGHSVIPARSVPPRLTLVSYNEAARAAGIDYGLNERILFGAPTIGNASVAMTAGPMRRSMPRLAMTTPRAMDVLDVLYAANHLYVYPEHRDHDPGTGDRFPASIPHVVISQGSSGSDRAFVLGLLSALEALRPDTARRLRDLGLIAPTLQMLLRRAMAGIESDEDYLSGAAHPTAFSGEALRRDRIIRLANAIAPEALPPLATLRVLTEGTVGPPPDPFAALEQERLFDTAVAVARVAKAPALWRWYEIEAAGRDADGRSVALHWRVLRGDGVRITPIDPAGRRVRVAVPWQGPLPVPGTADAAGEEGPITSTRVDIGVFADNGAHLSAPAIFSVYFPEDRRIERDAAGRPTVIDYVADSGDGARIDPLLSPLRPWRDDFVYASDGRHLGTVRTAGTERLELCRLGHRVLTRDSLGRPLLVEALDYRLEKGPGFRRLGRYTVVFTSGGVRQIYRYRDAADDVGELGAAP